MKSDPEIAGALSRIDDETALDRIKRETRALARRFPVYRKNRSTRAV